MSLNLAGCVILDKNKNVYLLHRDKKGFTQWELPGGKVEQGEDAGQAAVRELREELCVEVELNKKLGETSFMENDIKHNYVWFSAKIISGRLAIGEPETFDDLRSFPFDELAGLKLSNNMKKLHEAVLAKEVSLE